MSQQTDDLRAQEILKKRNRTLEMSMMSPELRSTLVELLRSGPGAVETWKVPLMSARLIRRGWLLRCIEVSMPDGIHFVEYSGRGFGYEQVSVIHC